MDHLAARDLWEMASNFNLSVAHLLLDFGSGSVGLAAPDMVRWIETCLPSRIFKLQVVRPEPSDSRASWASSVRHQHA